MGWYIHLTADKLITKDVVESCIDELSPEYKGHFNGSRQGWGWICAVDIFKPSENPGEPEIILHGSYTDTGKIAEDFAKLFAFLLEKRGYKIQIGEML